MISPIFQQASIIELQICVDRCAPKNKVITKLIYMNNYLEEFQHGMFKYWTLSPIVFFLPLKYKNRQ